MSIEQEKIIQYLTIIHEGKNVGYRGIAEQLGEGWNYEKVRNTLKGRVSNITPEDVKRVEERYWFFLKPEEEVYKELEARKEIKYLKDLIEEQSSRDEWEKHIEEMLIKIWDAVKNK